MLDNVFGLFSEDIGIDLGTANTLVLVRGKGIVIREPSVVAQHKKTKQILAIGQEAKKMLGKTPAPIACIRPLRDGVISDFDITSAMLSYFIKKVHQTPTRLPKLPRPRIVVGIPSGVTQVEKRAVAEAAYEAGARKAYLVEEPMAAAIGVGLTVSEPSGVMICDIGGGTTEIAVISLGGIVVGRSLRIAGDEMDEAIIAYIRTRYGVFLGERSAEEAKVAVGSAFPNSEEKEIVVRGRDLETGLPKSIKVSSKEIREAISPTLHQVVQAIQDTIQDTPPELLSDISENGIVLTGGGSLLSGLHKLIAQETKMPVWLADDPLTCVVRGCGKVLEDLNLLERVKVAGRII